MAEQDQFSWDVLLSAFRLEHPELYRAWFEDLEPGRIEGGELHVVVDDPDRARYLHEACAQPLIHLIMAMSGRLMPVRFRCPAMQLDGPLGTSRPAGLSRMGLNADHTFGQFVVGCSNRLAHAASEAVSDQPGALYNPLFIHGLPGTGKTHLLQAIAARLRVVHPSLEVVYTSADAFANDLIKALNGGGVQDLRDSARAADVLIIDDLQALSRYDSCQEEFFHTFNALYQSRRQLVLSADAPPAEIPSLEDRLVSRLHWGLLVQVDLPDLETRLAILQKKAQLHGCELPKQVLNYLAVHIEHNLHLLDSAITRIIRETQQGRKPPTSALARQVVHRTEPALGHAPQIAEILEAVSQHFGIRPSELLGRKRSRAIAHPRQVGMYLARRLTACSLKEIGAHFGGRDHSTVLHAERVIEATRSEDRRTAEAVSSLTRRLLAQQQDRS